MDADPPALVPVGDEASALAIADEVGLEPAGEPVLTGRGDEPVGDEHEGAVGERDAFGLPEVLVEDVPEARLVEQGADDEDRPPGRGIDDLGIGGIGGLGAGLAGEEPPELGEDLDEEVLASEIGDDALLDLAAFAVGFDDADVFVDGAAGGADFDGSRVHENHYHDESRRIKGNFREIRGDIRIRLSLHFSGRRGATPREEPGKQGVFARGSRRPRRLHPKHGSATTRMSRPSCGRRRGRRDCRSAASSRRPTGGRGTSGSGRRSAGCRAGCCDRRAEPRNAQEPRAMKSITFSCKRRSPSPPEEIAGQILDLANWTELQGLWRPAGDQGGGVRGPHARASSAPASGSRTRTGRATSRRSSSGSPTARLRLGMNGLLAPAVPPGDRVRGDVGVRADRRAAPGSSAPSSCTRRSRLTRPLLWLISLLLKRAITRHLRQMREDAARRSHNETGQSAPDREADPWIR